MHRKIQQYTIMHKRILLAILIILSAMPQAKSQIYYDSNHHQFNADSIRKQFDNGPYFTLFKDNYFIAGVPVGHKITSENSDVKFQVSIAQRLTKSTLPFHTYLFIAYSQKTFWNVFQESLPMRDLNFNPGIGLSKLLISKNRLVGKLTLLIEHESNGRDRLASRSWNKISFCGNIYLDPNLMVHGKFWIPIVDGGNNRDILRYSGIYQTGIQALSTNRRWVLSATFVKRKGGNFNANSIVELGFRIRKKDNQFLFLQYYNGYGENLLDYNKYHSRLRIGLLIKPDFFSDF